MGIITTVSYTMMENCFIYSSVEIGDCHLYARHSSRHQPVATVTNTAVTSRGGPQSQKNTPYPSRLPLTWIMYADIF